MFFSGSIFPMPRITLFTLFGHPVGPFELLAPTHAVNALNKVFTLGAGLAEVWYELAALTLLSAIYFAVGVWLFKRAHLN
jgi:ABC-2 type transport system permease protein